MLKKVVFPLIMDDHVLYFICYLGLSSIYFYAFFNIEKGKIYAFLLSLFVGVLLDSLQTITFLNILSIFRIIANIFGPALAILIN